MKKTAALLFAGLCAGMLFAGKDNVVITFSTPGPDTYADKTPVCDGEYYALVHTPNGSQFAGINPDGSAAGDSTVVIKAPIAKDGKCPFVQFQVNENYVRKNGLVDGTWSVVLLDTRRFKTDANGVVMYDSQNNPIVLSVGTGSVNGFGTVGQADCATMARATGTGNSSAGIRTAVKEGLLKITGIRVDDAFVYISAEGVDENLPYDVRSADDPGQLEKAESVLQYARKSEDGKVLFVRPKRGNSGFYNFGR